MGLRKTVCLDRWLVTAPALFLTLSVTAVAQPREFAAMKAALSDHSEARQAAALREMESWRLTQPELDELVAALLTKEGRPVVRLTFPFAANSAYLLGQTRDSRFAPALIAGLGCQRGGLDYECVLGLGRIGDRRAVKPLCMYLDLGQGRKMSRGAASYTLGRLGDPSAIPSLIKIMNESGRVFPEWDLLRFGEDAVQPLLAASNGKPSPELVFTLGELRDVRSLPRLKELATHCTDRHTRTAALFALRKLNTQECIDVLGRVNQSAGTSEDRALAGRLLADAESAARHPLNAKAVLDSPHGSAAVGDRLAALDELIESFDVSWEDKEKARDQAELLRRTYRYQDHPQTWASLVFLVTSTRTGDGRLHATSSDEQSTIRKTFESLVPDVDSASQGRLQLRLQFHVYDSVADLQTDAEGNLVIPKQIWKLAQNEMKTRQADHLFMTWVVPEGADGLPCSNSGAASHISIRRHKQTWEIGSFALEAIHEMVHSMNNCLWAVGYEEGQMPALHYGVAQIEYRSKRLDPIMAGTNRITTYLRRYFTGNMWAKLSRAGEHPGRRGRHTH